MDLEHVSREVMMYSSIEKTCIFILLLPSEEGLSLLSYLTGGRGFGKWNEANEMILDVEEGGGEIKEEQEMVYWTIESDRIGLDLVWL